MVKITTQVYRPGVDGPAFTRPEPRRDHGSRADVEREGFSARVINRGEQLSYIDASLGEVIAEVSIPSSWIDADTLDVWDFDSARPITVEEREQVLERIARFWLGYTGAVLRVIHGRQLRADSTPPD